MTIPEVRKGQKLTLEVALAIVARERRLALGLAQEDIEDEGLTQSAISKIERGVQKVELGTFVTLAQRLKIEPWNLLELVFQKIKDSSSR